MSTVLAFLLIFAQTIAVLIGYFAPHPALFETLVIYGSPPAMFMGLLNHNDMVSSASILMPTLILFHIIKYISLSRSHMVTTKPVMHGMAIIMELAYLATSIKFLF